MALVERAVWRHVRSEQVHVTNAEEYAQVAQQRCPNIHITYISKESTTALESFLDEKWKDVVAVPMTHQTHCVKTNGKNKLMVADNSDSTQFRIVRIRKEKEMTEGEEEGESQCHSGTLAAVSNGESVTLKVGEWVLVLYDGIEFPGEVVACGESEAEVSVMHRSGNSWRWPRNPDRIYYPLENIVRQIDAPTVTGSRGQFTFDGIP